MKESKKPTVSSERNHRLFAAPNGGIPWLTKPAYCDTFAEKEEIVKTLTKKVKNLCKLGKSGDQTLRGSCQNESRDAAAQRGRAELDPKSF